ncbi:quinone oxidoreductase family protein [Deinococcus marmoris]|uniref:Quinone oxidoreductase n=1 Tax=Deinococcus marmoris TaxID=249408 RepID=A0A1U7NVN5_9DEIO|nr:alcohol dehydrogenase catalytic domain-containing protein [Deinococcus marmoris]OLV16974.1 Quinone oxidoreductase [Deinococcus marmoris]
MNTMKAFARTSAESGEISMVDAPIPQIGNGEVLVRVRAFGIGIHDRYFIPKDAAFPYTIGTEGAGTVAAIGAGITGVSVSDRVIFTTSLQPQGGAWAEYAAVKSDTLIPLPGGLTFAQGAAVPIAGKAALESLNALGLQSGDALFIAGASGAIGSLVIQLAAAQGIRVAGSASKTSGARGY